MRLLLAISVGLMIPTATGLSHNYVAGTCGAVGACVVLLMMLAGGEEE